MEMTQKQKIALLLKDLCARLPFGVNVLDYTGRTYKLQLGNTYLIDLFYGNGDYVETPIRPYLRPMSSMTEEERIEFTKLLDKRYCGEDWEGHISTSYCIEIDNVYTDDEGVIKYPSSFSMDAIDWLNKKMFDYRGLIPMDLAMQATEDMYKNI